MFGASIISSKFEKENYRKKQNNSFINEPGTPGTEYNEYTRLVPKDNFGSGEQGGENGSSWPFGGLFGGMFGSESRGSGILKDSFGIFQQAREGENQKESFLGDTFYNSGKLLEKAFFE